MKTTMTANSLKLRKMNLAMNRRMSLAAMKSLVKTGRILSVKRLRKIASVNVMDQRQSLRAVTRARAGEISDHLICSINFILIIILIFPSSHRSPKKSSHHHSDSKKRSRDDSRGDKSKHKSKKSRH